MSLLGLYFLFGAGVYTGIACTRLKTFEGQSTASVVRGLALGWLLWPAGLAVVIAQQQEK